MDYRILQIALKVKSAQKIAKKNFQKSSLCDHARRPEISDECYGRNKYFDSRKCLDHRNVCTGKYLNICKNTMIGNYDKVNVDPNSLKVEDNKKVQDIRRLFFDKFKPFLIAAFVAIDTEV